MSVTNQPLRVESIVDYTTLWPELINRGGLYHINDEVFHLIEDIEAIVLQHLKVSSMQVDEGSDVRLKIIKEAVQAESYFLANQINLGSFCTSLRGDCAIT